MKAVIYALPSACAGGIQTRLNDLLHGGFFNLLWFKPSDGTAVQNGVHNFVHGCISVSNEFGSI